MREVQLRQEGRRREIQARKDEEGRLEDVVEKGMGREWGEEV